MAKRRRTVTDTSQLPPCLQPEEGPPPGAVPGAPGTCAYCGETVTTYALPSGRTVDICEVCGNEQPKSA